VQPVWLEGYVKSISRKNFLSAADELILVASEDQ
jgi:hypothetical protein